MYIYNINILYCIIFLIIYICLSYIISCMYLNVLVCFTPMYTNLVSKAFSSSARCFPEVRSVLAANGRTSC